MVDSDKSDNGESQTTGKRLHEDHSEDDQFELPSKRLRSKSPEHLESVDNKKDPLVQVTNGSAIASEERTIVKTENEHKNGEAMATDDDNEKTIHPEDPVKVKTEEIEAAEEIKEDATEEEEEEEEEEERVEVKKEIKIEVKQEEKEPLQDKSNDSEVVEGLELSVECASDKEESSSESEKEKDIKPRPKTIIIKAKPNDSELEIGSSEAEKSETDEEVADENATKKKRVGKKKTLSKESSSRSEGSLDSNSEDEDYSPRNKKKLKKTVTPKKATPQKTKAMKEQESKKYPVTDSEDDKSKSEDEEMTLADRAKKRSIKTVEKKNQSDSESKDATDSTNDSDAGKKKNGKRKSKNTDPKDDKSIKRLKRYVTMAGLRPKYDDLWSGCRTNRQRANRIKQLLKDSGIEGQPSIIKCKKLKLKNATMKEIAELDTSNIIAEGRVTRARRIEANKANLRTPTEHEEARNLFKRIQPVCDSDTE